MGGWHRHDWQLLDKTVLTHPVADVIRADKVDHVNLDNLESIEDRVVYVFKCSCGRVRVEER